MAQQRKQKLKTMILIASKPIVSVEELRVDQRRFSKDDYMVDHERAVVLLRRVYPQEV